MSGAGHIKYLSHKEIDKTKWDSCINKAANGLVYGYSFYLDCMAAGWDALVLNDYEMVMPLPWKKKYGICYLYQPFLTAQLGIFGSNLNNDLIERFLNAVPLHFRYWDICLNAANVVDIKKYRIYTRKNYLLHLNSPYDLLSAQYKETTQRNIKKSAHGGFTVQKDFEADLVTELALHQMKERSEETAENVKAFKNLYALLHVKKMARTYGIMSAESMLLASCIFFFSHNRAYYILVGNHPDSKATGASHALIDAFIKDYAGTDTILDFEGSDIPGLAFFYSSFGAAEEKYAGLKLNRLPFFIRWLKK